MGKGAQQRGLADAHIALQQRMAASEGGNRDQPDRARLTNDRTTDSGFERQRASSPVGQQGIGGTVHALSIAASGWTWQCVVL